MSLKLATIPASTGRLHNDQSSLSHVTSGSVTGSGSPDSSQSTNDRALVDIPSITRDPLTAICGNASAAPGAIILTACTLAATHNLHQYGVQVPQIATPLPPHTRPLRRLHPACGCTNPVKVHHPSLPSTEKLVLVDNYFLYGAYTDTIHLIMLYSYTAWQAHECASPSAG